MVVAVVGDVQHDEVFQKLGDGVRRDADAARSRRRTPRRSRRWCRGSQTDTSPGQQARVIAGGATVGYDSPDRHVLDVIEAILGESGRRLEREFVDTQAIASSAYPFYYPLTDVGVWGISVGARPADVDRVVELTKAQLRALRETPVAPEELDEAKAYLRGQRLLNRERSVDLAEELSDGEALGTYEPMDDVPQPRRGRHRRRHPARRQRLPGPRPPDADDPPPVGARQRPVRG